MSTDHHDSPTDSRSAEARRDDARRNDARRNDERRNDARRNDARRNDERRNDERWDDQRWDALGTEESEDQDFWGDQADWPTAAIPVVEHEGAAAPVPPVTPDRASTTTRQHRVVRAPAVAISRRHRAAGEDVTDPGPEAPAATTMSGDDDTPVAPVWDDRWAPSAPARSNGVDPRLLRVGAIAVIVTLLVPVLAALRSGDVDDFVTMATEDSAAESTLAPETAGAIEDTAEDDATASPTVAPDVTVSAAAAATDGAETAAPAETAATDDAAGSDDSADTASGSESASAAAEGDGGNAESAVQADQLCAVDYEVRVGDFWLRLADGAGVELAELLDANGATVDTPLYPGRTICLPAGSTTPPPPPSNSGSGGSSSGSTGSSGSGTTQTTAPRPAPTSPPTTAAPTTAAPTTAAPTTAAPTTAAPTTTAPPPPPPPPAPAEVEQIIRNIWPDELEDKALQIAWRESNYKANVNNYCCYGLFQIYWNVHRSWLQELGINSATDLYDAEANTRAAYVLYQRAGGWGPWGG